MRRFVEEMLHDAVFERMKRDDGETSFGFEKGARGAERRAQFVQFPVHGDPHGLKGPRGGMLIGVLSVSRHDGRNKIGELLCGTHGRRGATLDDAARDGTGEALFAVHLERMNDVFLRAGFEPLRGGGPRCRVHAHVKGAVEAEAESPLGVVNLRRGNADVEENPVDRRDAALGERFAHRREGSMHNREARIRNLRRGPHGFEIAVKRDQASVGREFREDAARMPAPAESTVDV